jgi:NTP pyrophosphatase (non-canonical NTP hydrolase)
MSLTFTTFSAANRARCESALGFAHPLESWSLSDWFTATMGELGEAANVAKKLNRIRDKIPGKSLSEAELRAQLRREIADTFIYLDLLAQAAGFSLEDAVRETWDAKSAQIGYPGRLSGPPGPNPEDP